MVIFGANLCLLLTVTPLLAAANYHVYASTPPMGRNSWDCFGTTVTVFNIRNTAKDDPASATAIVPVNLLDLGFSGKVQVHDLWQQQNLELVNMEFAPEVPAHGARLFRIVRLSPLALATSSQIN